MEKGNKNIAIRFIKGVVIGAVMLVPGVSGGTMAIILGIYDDLIHSLSTLRRKLKRNSFFLGTFALAALLGMLLFSRPMLTAVTLWHYPMIFLFLGAILGSIPPLYRKVKVSRIKLVNVLVACFGAFIGIMTLYLPSGIIQLDTQFDLYYFLMLILAGLIIAVALVLPGISASYILLMLGMYDITLMAIKDLNLFYLVPLAVGVIGGTLLTAGVLEKAMKRHTQFTYMLIIGFMLGSLVQIFPGIPPSNELFYCVLTFFSGFIVILWLGRRRQY
jgi:putative membrane protein